ncbi:hypothetical protein [Nocardia sienata]|uniref:hypothetical protein n=1 Tax=Nocardia sienata TaxID=248552 RepID=UPI000A44B6EE|nr:hypothetical protein [Nocardia sienata]
MTRENRRCAIVVGSTTPTHPIWTASSLVITCKWYSRSPRPRRRNWRRWIAVQHLFEHDAEVVVVPHLSAAEIRAERCWRAVSGLADILAADGGWLQ